MLVKKITIIFLIIISFSYAKNNSLISELTNFINKEENIKEKNIKVLNYAFKQRMRTQLIARDALLIYIDFNSTFYKKNIIINADLFNDLFNKNFNKLMSSREAISKAEKRDSIFNKKVDEFKEIWFNFYDSVKKISKDNRDKNALLFIENNNIKLLDSISYISKNFIGSYQSRDKLEASMAHIKSILYIKVGKPRMYITKLVKERLLIDNNINIKENKKSLNQTIKDMDRLMKALKNGDKELEVEGTESRKILDKLSISQKIWEDLKALIVKDKLTKDDWKSIIEKNNEFIKAQTEVLKLTRELSDD